MLSKYNINKGCVCSIVGCSNQARIRGLCKKHYQNTYFYYTMGDYRMIVLKNLVVEK